MTQEELVKRLREVADLSVWEALRHAEDLAIARGDRFIGVEHLFLVLADVEPLRGALASLGVAPQRILQALSACSTKFQPLWEGTLITPRAQAILSAAVGALLPGERLDVTKLLSALFRDSHAAPVRVLRELGVDGRRILGALKGPPSQPQSPVAAGQASTRGPSKTPCLDSLGRDLTEAAAQGALDPLIDRDRELDQLVDVLCLRRAANPLLIGDPGVGKTAIVEGLAQRIAEGKIPSLRGCRVVSLEVSALLADTGVFGALQQRVQCLIRELEDNPHIILFVDEVHCLVSSALSPALDVSQMFLPALARGLIRCVGATTNAEYQRIIVPQEALARRFECIPIKELSRNQTRDVLLRLRPHLERHYRVAIPEEAIEAALEISKRFEHRRKYPEKALRLLERGAVKAMRGGRTAVGRGDLVEAVCDLVPDLDPLFVHQHEDVLEGLEETLLHEIKGQDEAVRRTARAMRRFHGPLQDDSMRPRGVLLFAGPTGVGKTLTAKVLAECLFGSRNAMIRIDMSEYMERHDVAKLIGAPPGYVGHEEGGQLTRAVWDRPFSIVLLDEIDKAHPEVLNILLQVLDDGVLTDGRGRKVAFTNTTIIMTTNRGAAAGQASRNRLEGFRVERPQAVGGEPAQFAEAVLHVIQEEVAPELLGRIDEKIVFQPLSADACSEIIGLELDRISKKIREKGLSLRIELGSAARDEILRRADFERFGAREIRRCVKEIVDDYVLENWRRLRSRRSLRLEFGEHGFVWNEE